MKKVRGKENLPESEDESLKGVKKKKETHPFSVVTSVLMSH